MERSDDQQGMETTAENPFVVRFAQFFENTQKKNIEKLVSKYPEKRSLEIDFKELEHYDFELADELLQNPDYVLEAAQLAIQGIDVPALNLDEFKPHVRIFNLPEEAMPILRDIGSAQLSKLLSVEGTIVQITEVLPKLLRAVWECRRCGNTYTILQSSNNQQQPTVCECRAHDFTLKSNTSTFVDFQKIRVQEPIELIKGNQQPTNLDVYVIDDLVNKVTPGDRIKATGILRLVPPKEKKLVYGRFLEAVHIEETEKNFEEVEITKEEEEEIRKLAKDKEVYEKLVKSIAPNIYGHEVVKESIALQLFGGVKKILPGQNRIRGNIHILLVGEPGVAKSQLLQAVDNIAPKSIYSAGKTTSAAGLSATAVKDEFGEGGWTLKAGALVLASGGMALIDELDKMDPEDRSALHEALEQESISVAKAGIVTRFKTETSVLSAANPKYSRFDPYQNFMEQINLPASLVSRFDLFFMIRDVLDRKKDEEISAHILKTHQAGEMMLQQIKNKSMEKQKEVAEMEKLITPAIEGKMMKKYISYARQNIFPVLTAEAIKNISDFYIDLRDQGKKQGTYTATHRQLEGLVRLSEASARVRLSDTVEIEDTDRAIRLFRTALQELVVDQETGKIDFDIINVGRTQTELTNLKKILGIIKDKAREIDMVPMQEVIDEAKTQGLDEEKTKEIFSKLEKAGDIYRPKYGFVKPTQPK
ncbi:MAG: minichromosome maintenance protein MCM [Candidatus Diapherotrites archaeon]|nr:minichromosome maintenance protein MCM [Candidatus Diapherotrites archaeon]